MWVAVTWYENYLVFQHVDRENGTKWRFKAKQKDLFSSVVNSKRARVDSEQASLLAKRLDPQCISELFKNLVFCNLMKPQTQQNRYLLLILNCGVA